MSAAGKLSHVLAIFKFIHTNHTVSQIKLVHNSILPIELHDFYQVFVFFNQPGMICSSLGHSASLCLNHPLCSLCCHQFHKVKLWRLHRLMSWILIVLLSLKQLLSPRHSNPDDHCEDRGTNTQGEDTCKDDCYGGNTHPANRGS